jgi:RhtB (resistance to homoserine/threonine) family protein
METVKMTGIHDFPAFLVAGIALNLMPGADTLYIIGQSLSRGRKAGVVSVLGISTGSLFHTLAAALGLSTILATSSLAFSTVKYIGAVYLIYLGVKMLKEAPARTGGKRVTPAKMPLGKIFRQGVLTNISNPKVALFFLAFLPQFISPEGQQGILPFLLLGVTFVFTGTCWCLFVAYTATTLARRIGQKSAPARLFKKITGALFIGLGLKLAYEKMT